MSIIRGGPSQLCYDLGGWIFFPLMEFEAEKNIVQVQVQVQVQAAGQSSLQTKTFSSDN